MKTIDLAGGCFWGEQNYPADAEYIMLSTATKNWKAIFQFYLEELDMRFWSARLFKKIENQGFCPDSEKSRTENTKDSVTDRMKQCVENSGTSQKDIETGGIIYKDVHIGGISYIELVPGGTQEWYYGIDRACGDLYEAEELTHNGQTIEGNDLCLVHYPNGEICRPVPKKTGTYTEAPVFLDGWHPGGTLSVGEITAVTGANGAGKTSLLSCICGLEKLCKGTLEFEGRIFSRKDRKKLCFMVMQDTGNQLFTESVLEEVLISLPKETENEKEYAAEILVVTHDSELIHSCMLYTSIQYSLTLFSIWIRQVSFLFFTHLTPHLFF